MSSEHFPIPFNRPSLAGRELEHLQKAVAAGHISGDGEYARKCAGFLSKRCGAGAVMLTPSCTAALEMTALLLDLRPGDEVVMPSFTFVSTANAYALRGAVPVFADIRPDTLNLDETRLEEAFTSRTRAVVVVHYGGVGCEMDAICRAAALRGLAVVEDNAHGLGGFYRGRPLGSLATMAALSFHETKNLSCGEGGALLLHDSSLVEQAEIIRDKGTNRRKFLSGAVDKYTWVGLGSSYVMSDLLAAYLWGQLECMDQIMQRRKVLWNRYAEGLKSWAEKSGVQLPVVPAHCASAHHLFYLLLPTPQARGRFLDHMRSHGCLAVFHYQPLHLSPMARNRSGFRPLPVTERVSSCLARLPFFTGMTDAEQARVMEAVEAFRP